MYGIATTYDRLTQRRRPRSLAPPISSRTRPYEKFRVIVCAAASLIGVRIQKPHNVRLARIEFEAIDRDLELLSYEASLRAPEFCAHASPRTHSPSDAP